jgi:hypothetical protein
MHITNHIAFLFLIGCKLQYSEGAEGADGADGGSGFNSRQ